jgi:hypothetical protein
MILDILISTKTEKISIIVLVTASTSGGKSPVKNAIIFWRIEIPLKLIVLATAVISDVTPDVVRRELIDVDIADAVLSVGIEPTASTSSSGMNPRAVLTTKTARIGNSDFSMEEFSKYALGMLTHSEAFITASGIRLERILLDLPGSNPKAEKAYLNNGEKEKSCHCWHTQITRTLVQIIL